MLSTLCHFHGLLFAWQMLDKTIRRNPVQCAAHATGCSSVSLVIECIDDFALFEREDR
jgi:hypothetical protein